MLFTCGVSFARRRRVHRRDCRHCRWHRRWHRHHCGSRCRGNQTEQRIEEERCACWQAPKAPADCQFGLQARRCTCTLELRAAMLCAPCTTMWAHGTAWHFLPTCLLFLLTQHMSSGLIKAVCSLSTSLFEPAEQVPQDCRDKPNALPVLKDF